MKRNQETTKQAKKFGFGVEIFNITRDYIQGQFKSLVPLNSPRVLNIFERVNTLYNTTTLESTTRFVGVEMGGVQPQADSEFLGLDYTQTTRDIRKVAPDITIRPLRRGPNGPGLSPIHENDLQWSFTQDAMDAAGVTSHANQELLRPKVFDSQANIKEIESSTRIIGELRKKGKLVGMEVAIPYSNGEKLGDKNPFTDEYYLNKFKEAAALAKQHGIPNEVFTVSLKDMGGQLSAENAARLTRKIIQQLKNDKLEIKLALHLHDTGLATEAYAAAINVCKEENWPVIVDTAETALEPDSVEGHKTGFVSTLSIDKKLKEKYGFDLGLTEEQKKLINKIEVETDAMAEEYAVCRVEGSLTGEELRLFRIPGGGLSPFEDAVKALIPAKLGISAEDAFKLAGHALITASEMMGSPHLVTPAFKHAQTAALNLVNNMIKAKILHPDMSVEAMINTVKKPLTNVQVTTLFLEGLSNEVKEFLKGEMPAELHPIVREACPRREGLSTDQVQSRLPELEKTAKALQSEGKIANTDAAFHAAVSRGIVLGSGAKLRDKFDNPGKSEPDPSHYPTEAECKKIQAKIDEGRQVTDYEKERLDSAYWLKGANPGIYTAKEEYNRIRALKKGLKPEPDAVEDIRKALMVGDITAKQADAAIEKLLISERDAIHASVKECIAENKTIFDKVASNITALGKGEVTVALEHEVKQAIKALYNQQKYYVKAKLTKGEQYLYPENERIEKALHFFAKQMALPENDTSKARFAVVERLIEEVLEDIGRYTVSTKCPGVILKLFVEASNGKEVEVKAGDPLFVIEAMKMETTVKAERDGKISRIAVKQGEIVSADQVIIEYKNEQAQEVTTNIHLSIPTIKDAPPMALSALLGCEEEQSNTSSAVQVVTSTKPETQSSNLMQKRGYNAPVLSLGEKATLGKGEVLHIIANRAGCATKIAGDLKQCGQDVRILYTDGDNTTPLSKYAGPNEMIKVTSYTNQTEIINTLKNIAKENPNKTIALHPGWGFLAEKDDFVKRMETELGGYNIVFAGPPSEPMRIAGGKKTFRDVVQEAAPEFNPKYFGGEKASASELQEYISSAFSKTHRLDAIYRENFRKIQDMGGDVMLKAVAGGGGRGIKNFKCDHTKSDEENYQNYILTLKDNVAISEKLFADGEMLTEQCIRGNTHHMEVQFAASGGEAITLGLRNCTAQIDGPKICWKSM